MFLKKIRFEDILAEKFQKIADISYQSIRSENGHFGLWYHQRLCSVDKMEKYVIGRLEELLKNNIYQLEQTHFTKLKSLSLSDFDAIEYELFSGSLLIYSPNINQLYSLNLNDAPNRTAEVSPSEITIAGARDSFIESIHVNSAIIRQRIKSSHLKYETFYLGQYSHTLVGLIYMDNLADEEMVNAVRERIKSLTVEAITSIGQFQSLLTNKPKALMPTMSYTARTDFTAQSLLTGRFAVFVDGIPLASIAPVNLSFFTNYSDSSNELFFVGLMDRIVQYSALFISLFLLGFATSLLAYSPEFIPLVLLANIANTRKGIGMSITMELILADIFFQLFRIAGLRSLYGLNNALLIIGSIIIGQIAVSAGIISQTVLFITAMSVISSYLISNDMSFNTSIIIMRTFIFFSSILFGYLGFVISSFVIITYILNLESFGMPILSPLSPLRLSSLKTIFSPTSNPNKPKHLRDYYNCFKGEIKE